MKKLWLAVLILAFVLPSAYAANTSVQVTPGTGQAYGCVTDASNNCHNTFVGGDGTNPLQYWAINSSGQLAVQLGPGASTSANQTSQITQETATAAALGTTADTAWSGSGNASVVAALKALYGAATSSIPAGTNNIGSVNTVTSTVTLVALDVATVTTGGTAVTALNPGHRNKGGWLQNPVGASVNLCINEIGTASGTTSAGNTTCIIPGARYTLAPSGNGVSVISSDSSHPFSGMGLN